MTVDAIAGIAVGQPKGRHYNVFELFATQNSPSHHRHKTTYVDFNPETISRNSVFSLNWGTSASEQRVILHANYDRESRGWEPISRRDEHGRQVQYRRYFLGHLERSHAHEASCALHAATIDGVSFAHDDRDRFLVDIPASWNNTTIAAQLNIAAACFDGFVAGLRTN